MATPKKNPEDIKRKGVPDTFTQDVADLLCDRIASGSRGLVRVLEEMRKENIEGVPSVVTIFNWFDLYPHFLKQYTRAKQIQADYMADEIIDIADNDNLDIGFNDEGKPFVNHEHINRSRLRVDARKWVASKLKPKVYGDKPPVDEDEATAPTPVAITIQMVDARK